MVNGIITILVGVIIGWLGGKFLNGILAKVVSIVGLVITIIGIYYLIVSLI